MLKHRQTDEGEILMKMTTKMMNTSLSEKDNKKFKLTDNDAHDNEVGNDENTIEHGAC